MSLIENATSKVKKKDRTHPTQLLPLFLSLVLGYKRRNTKGLSHFLPPVNIEEVNRLGLLRGRKSPNITVTVKSFSQWFKHGQGSLSYEPMSPEERNPLDVVALLTSSGSGMLPKSK